MRKLLLAGVAVLALGAAGPAFAQDNDASAGAAAGGAVGGVTGGTIGFFLGGPVGAIIGGFTGSVIGANAGVAASTVEYTANNPVDPIDIDARLDVGYVVDDDIRIYDIEGDDRYGYFYANNRVYIVDRDSREIVQSPGFVIPERTVAYIRDNPSVNIEWSGDLAPGVTLEGDFELHGIDGDNDYAYVYVDDRPVLVDRHSNVVVWVG